jgi:hypothetical protein
MAPSRPCSWDWWRSSSAADGTRGSGGVTSARRGPPAREPPSLDAAAGLEFLAAALVAGALLLWAIAPDGLTAREQRAAAVLAAGTLTAVVLFALDPAWRRARRAHRSRLPGGP